MKTLILYSDTSFPAPSKYLFIVQTLGIPAYGHCTNRFPGNQKSAGDKERERKQQEGRGQSSSFKMWLNLTHVQTLPLIMAGVLATVHGQSHPEMGGESLDEERNEK